MSALTAAQNQRLRGVILELVHDGHQRQEPRLDDLSLYLALSDLRNDVSRNDTLTLVQDLGDRGYLKYVQERNEYTGRVTVHQIQITPKGRDLVELIARDPAVRIFK